MMKIAVSACLLGHNVRYDGSNKQNNELLKLLKNSEVIPICPEVLGGLNIPHLPCEINGNQVINSNKDDVTKYFKSGSLLAYEKIQGCDFVILKTKSPSCGYRKIYDGSFSGKLIDGNGIFAQICINNKIKIYTENDIELIKAKINGD